MQLKQEKRKEMERERERERKREKKPRNAATLKCSSSALQCEAVV